MTGRAASRGRRYAAALLLAVLACVGAHGAHAAEVLFEQDGWTVLIGKDRDTGAFTRCGMTAAYEDGTELTFAYARSGSFELILKNESWELTPGAEHDVSVQVDDHPLRKVTGQAVKKTAFLISFRKSEELERLIRFGKTLYIYGEGQDLAYLLNGTLHVLPKVKTCMQQAMRDSGKPKSRNPFAAAPGGKREPEEAMAYRLTGPEDKEAKAFISGLMSSHYLRAFEIMAREDMNDGLEDVPMAWEDDLSVGFVMHASGLPIREMMSQLAKEEGSSCAENFATTNEVVRVSRRLELGRLTASCLESEPGYIYMILYPVTERDFFVVYNVSRDREGAFSADDNFFEAIKEQIYGM